jgi:predicted nucleotidyltransferase
MSCVHTDTSLHTRIFIHDLSGFPQIGREISEGLPSPESVSSWLGGHCTGSAFSQLQDFAKRVFDSLPQVQSVVLFGSAARGEFTKASDVDILAVVPTLEQEAFNRLMKSVDSLAAETRGVYGFPISAVTMTMKDWEAAVRENKRIAQDVMREGFVLFGEDRYYQLLARVISE